MVFVKDLKKEFYDVIQHQRVLMLVGYDVDALCTCKILQYLFQCDHILYTIVPISGKQELMRAFIEHSEGVTKVIMINCGATIDVVETLKPEEDVIFYICDSHRPVDVCNIYNLVQVKLLMKEEEFDTVPDYDDLFRDDESDEDSGNESDSSQPSGKRRRFDEEALEKRREKRLWTENRNKVLFEYSQYSSFGTSAAIIIFELAWKMSKDTNDLLWLAIVGITDQYLHYKIERDKYIEDIGQLQSHVSRHNHRADDDDSNISVDCLRISFDQELHLSLYRHWSLFESICHTIYPACKFKVWTVKGRKRLHEFLADMGLPLVQCRQKFSSMDVNFKGNVKQMIGDQVEKYSEQELFLPSFRAQYGFRNKFCASDIVAVTEATLESIDKDKSASDSFLQALDVLDRKNVDAMEKGLDLAKLQLTAVVKQVQSFLDINQVISAGPFLYVFVQEGTPDGPFFSKPICLQKLAKYALEAFSCVTKSKKAKNLPLVLGAPMDAERGTTLIVGIPPVTDTTRRNFFGKAFEQAASITNSRTIHDSFDNHIVEMKTEDKSKFFDALISLLQ